MVENESALTDNEAAFKKIKDIIDIVPIPIYWLDIKGVMLGTNKYFKDIISAPSDFNPIGKTAYDAYPKEIADVIVNNNNLVMQTGKTLTQEDPGLNLTTGEKKFLASVKSPIRGDDGKVIGLIGVYIDITAEKEAQALKLKTEKQQSEIEKQQIEIKEQEIFKKDVSQLIHDIMSPLATIQIILKTLGQTIPELERINLANAANTIRTMATNLRGKYSKTKEIEQPANTMIALLLSQVLEERKLQNTNAEINFTSNFNDCYFSSIYVTQLALKRAVMNLLNNAVDAIDTKGTVSLDLTKSKGLINGYTHQIILNEDVILKEHEVGFYKKNEMFYAKAGDSAGVLIPNNELNKSLLHLLATVETTPNDPKQFETAEAKQILTENTLLNSYTFINIIIKDTGKGIPKEVLDKINNNIPVTSGKKEGHGVGYTQIHDAAKNNHGTVKIDSVVNQGTTVTIQGRLMKIQN